MSARALRIPLACTLLTLAACSDNATPVIPSGPPDCTWQTPLTPGIPGSPGNLIPSDRNPNGVSELAHLMRQFVDDLQRVQARIAAGRSVDKLYPKHKKIRCAWPTDPSERNEEFDRRAVVYLDAVQAFDRSPGKDSFNAIVNGCIACHSVSCRGPIDMIARHEWK